MMANMSRYWRTDRTKWLTEHPLPSHDDLDGTMEFIREIRKVHMDEFRLIAKDGKYHIYQCIPGMWQLPDGYSEVEVSELNRD